METRQSTPSHRTSSRWARDRPEVLVLSADLTVVLRGRRFPRRLPERFFSMGMAEQNMMGFAGGLAREGFRPFVHTFAVFICRRPFDQVAMSIAYPNLPVRLLGFLPGITTPGGVTHQAIDDVALMRVASQHDRARVRRRHRGRVGARRGRGRRRAGLRAHAARRGAAAVRRERADAARPGAACSRQGDDVAVVFERHLHRGGDAGRRGARRRAASRSAPARLDAQAVRRSERSSKRSARARHGVITLENHSIIGGLGSAVAELMAEAGARQAAVRLGLAGHLRPRREPRPT